MRHQPRWGAWVIPILLPAIYPVSLAAFDDTGPPLTGTKPLTMTGDIASELVAGVDRFLLKQINRVDGQPCEILEAGFFLPYGIQQIGRAKPSPAGEYFGNARSAVGRQR